MTSNTMPEWLKKYYEDIKEGIARSKEKDKLFWENHPNAKTVEVHIQHKDWNVTPSNEDELKRTSDLLKDKITHVQLNDGSVASITSITPNKIPKYNAKGESWIKKILKQILEGIRSLLKGIQK